MQKLKNRITGRYTEITEQDVIEPETKYDFKFPECLKYFYLKYNERLDELDDKYNNKLKWDMLESDVTEEQLVMFEQENDLILPKQFREFALGYSEEEKCKWIQKRKEIINEPQ